jgi:hypothetical protein
MKTAHALKTNAETANWIAPGSALCFSVLMAFLGPLYAHMWAAAMPPFTREFLGLYPLWIALSTLALLVLAIGRQFRAPTWATRALRLLEGTLTLASILIMAAGLIALFLPIFSRADVV